MKRERIIEEYNGLHGEFWKRESIKNIDKFKDTYKENDIIRWKSNNSIPPKDLLKLWNYIGLEFDLDKTLKQYEKDTDEFLSEYRKNKRVVSKEELQELKANFGEGTVVIDVVTGEKIKL